MIRVLLGDLLVLLAGHGALRAGCGRWPLRAYGPLLAAGLCWLTGVAALGSVTTLVGVLGGRTTPLPVIAPVLGLLAVAGFVPPRMGRRPADQPPAAAGPAAATGPVAATGAAPARATAAATGTAATAGAAGEPVPAGTRGRWIGSAVCAVVAVGIGARTAALAAHVPVLSNDEYAIWMVRARTLSQFGALDPRVFLGDAAHYTTLNYPLFLPSLVAWGDGWAGRPSDAAAHLGIATLVAALLAVVGAIVDRLAGPLPAVAAVVLIAAIPTLLSWQSVLMMADVPVFAFSLALAVVLLAWLWSPSRVLLVAAAALGAGATGMKVEGLVFTAAVFLAALLLARSGRRGLLAAGAVAVLANLPWLIYCQIHGLRSWIANDRTLNMAHLRDVLPFTGRVLRGMVDRWPGTESGLGVLLLVAVLPAAALAVRAGHARLVGYLGVVVLLDTAVLAAQYVISAYGPPSDPVVVRLLDGQLAVTVFRVTMLPAALLMIAVPVLAGLVMRTGDRPVAADPGRPDSAEPTVPVEPAHPAEPTVPAETVIPAARSPQEVQPAENAVLAETAIPAARSPQEAQPASPAEPVPGGG